MAEGVSLEGAVEMIDGKLAILIPLETPVMPEAGP